MSPDAGRCPDRRRRRWPTSPSAPASRGRRSPTRSTTPTCSAPTRSSGCRRRSTTLGYSPNRAARNLRTRTSHLIGLRFTPAQEGTANALMDRFVHSLVETSREAGYHVLLFAGEPEDPLAGYDDLLRSTAVDAFVATDTYLGNPQAAWLEARRAPVRRLRPAVGQPGRRPPVGRRRRRRRRRAGHHPPARPRATSGSPGSAGARTPGSARTAAPAGAGRCATRGLATTGLASRVEDTVASGREAAPCSSTRPSRRAFVCASDTLAMGVLHTLAERGLRRAATSPSSASTTPRSPRWCRRGSPRCASRSRRSPSRS